MKIIVAKSAGFCFGVERAVSMCEKAAREIQKCVTLGPIIHNTHVIRDLENKGVRAVADISEITHEDTVIIRSHGAGRNELEALTDSGVDVIDATCPDVKKIHDIVREESGSGRHIIIIGQHFHPEITAISSWCDSCDVFETADELLAWLQTGDNADKPISVVFQTTNTKAVYQSCVEIIKKVCTNSKEFDTICNATFKRQQEAAELSGIADVMIVVGGKNSANSLKLADICRENCQRVIFAESADDLEGVNVRMSDVVGITAGASTPAWIIKEVTHKMSEEVKSNETRAEQELQSSPPEPEQVMETVANTGLEEAEETRAVEVTAEVVNPVLPAEPCAVSTETDSAQETAAEEESPVSEKPEPAEVPVDAEEPGTVGETGAITGDEQAGAASVPETFEEMLEKSIKTLHTGEKVTGVVTSITATEVSVDLGTKQSGYIPISEFTDDTNSNIEDVIKIGDAIEAFVMRVNDVEGMVMLSKRRLDAVKNWDVIEAAKESRAIVEGMVTEENKGGVVVNIKGVRVFVPASQTGLPKSAPMSDLVKKVVKLRITEVNQSRRRVVGSIRAVHADERREKSDRVWSDIEVGKQYDGAVKSMTSYGVFVDIGGVDGMIHISELSWTRIKQPSEVMSIGDVVIVYVLSFDKDNRKISLGFKKNEDNPWTRFTTQNSVGDIVRVKIVKMMPFGAFAEICPGVDGLIHISQITDHRIGLPSEVLSDGQMVDVKITEIDNDRKKVSLSIRALLDPASQPLTEREIASSVSASADKSPVIVYDTDAPPALAPDFEDKDAEDASAKEETEGSTVKDAPEPPAAAAE